MTENTQIKLLIEKLENMTKKKVVLKEGKYDYDRDQKQQMKADLNRPKDGSAPIKKKSNLIDKVKAVDLKAMAKLPRHKYVMTLEESNRFEPGTKSRKTVNAPFLVMALSKLGEPYSWTEGLDFPDELEEYRDDTELMIKYLSNPAGEKKLIKSLNENGEEFAWHITRDGKVIVDAIGIEDKGETFW